MHHGSIRAMWRSSYIGFLARPAVFMFLISETTIPLVFLKVLGTVLSDQALGTALRIVG
jgi:hypothetical protein